MATIVTRASKGSALTWTEGDANITNLNNDKIELTDLSASTSGDGSLSYNNTSGVFTYTGPGTSNYRAAFSAGTGISITDGVIASTIADTNTTYSISAETATGGVNLRLTGSDSSTDDVKLAQGTNITLTRTDANTITIDSTASGGVTVTNDTTTNATRYLVFEDVTSGTVSTVGVSNTKLTFNPSTGVVTASGFSGPLTGNASSATYASAVTLTADNSTNATNYPLFANAATGNLSPRTDTGFTYNPSTGVLTATGFSGAFNGTIGATTPSSANFTTVTIGGNRTQAGLFSSGTIQNVTTGSNYTDTTSSGTISQVSVNAIYGSYLDSTNNITITDLATLFIAAPGINTAKITANNSWSVYTQAGIRAGYIQCDNQFVIRGQNELRLADSDSTNWVGFKAPATVSSNNVWTLPASDGTSGQVLSTNGSGTLSWASAGGGVSLALLTIGSATGQVVSGNLYRCTLTESSDISSIVSLPTSYTFRLPAGTYQITYGASYASVPGTGSTAGQSLIVYNETGSSTFIENTLRTSSTNNFSTGPASKVVTLSTNTDYSIRVDHTRGYDFVSIANGYIQIIKLA